MHGCMVMEANGQYYSTQLNAPYKSSKKEKQSPIGCDNTDVADRKYVLAAASGCRRASDDLDRPILKSAKE
jgi:hypothetical protein